ncbi:MAG: hypothetical protein NVS3B10_12430 [Polyangiales bacterium]
MPRPALPFGLSFRLPLGLAAALGCARVTTTSPDAAASSAPSTPSAPALAAATPSPPVDSPLQQALAAIVAGSDGVVGVTVLHLRTGERASVHGGRRLPMMSVFKLPLAVVTLAAIDDGTWTMATRVPIAPSELRPTVSPLAEAWQKGERSPTLETMLRLVLQASDNTAGDKLVTWNGGGAKITARLRAMHASGIDVAEQELEIFARLGCAGTSPPAGGWSTGAIDACPKPTAEAERAAVQREIESSPNGATADGLVDLLAQLDRGTILSDASRRWLRATLLGTTTGPARLKGRLPDGTPVEHKTGTGDTVAGVTVAVNDVGIVQLPTGDRLAIAVLVAGAHGGASSGEGTIARLARASWDAFAR